MRRIATSILLPIAALMILALPTYGAVWCKRDPIVRLNGTQVQILVAVPEDKALLVNGPIAVRITTPGSVSREVLLMDAGFNGYGETLVWANSGSVSGKNVPIEVRVKVPTIGGVEVPALFEVIPDNAPMKVVQGESDGITTKMTITGR